MLQGAAGSTHGAAAKLDLFVHSSCCRGPRPLAHGAAQQPLVAGSLMPSFEDPQGFLSLPEGLLPRKVGGRSWVPCRGL